MRKSIVLAAAFTAFTMLLSGCASSLTGDSYSRADARKVQTIRMGTIESLRPFVLKELKHLLAQVPVLLLVALLAVVWVVVVDEQLLR